MALGSHQRTVGKSQTHLTPKWLIDALGPFDLDPCAAPEPRPWDCARLNYTAEGLHLPWLTRDRIWLNPPFDRYQVGEWVHRLARQGNGIALLHARTETEWFKPVWDYADGILFLARRIKFCRADGSEQGANSGAPPVLCAFGKGNVARLARCGISGHLVTKWTRPVKLVRVA